MSALYAALGHSPWLTAAIRGFDERGQLFVSDRPRCTSAT
jgi:hypothetical protein